MYVATSFKFSDTHSFTSNVIMCRQIAFQNDQLRKYPSDTRLRNRGRDKPMEHDTMFSVNKPHRLPYYVKIIKQENLTALFPKKNPIFNSNYFPNKKRSKHLCLFTFFLLSRETLTVLEINWFLFFWVRRSNYNPLRPEMEVISVSLRFFVLLRNSVIQMKMQVTAKLAQTVKLMG